MFDSFVILASFVVDLIFIKGLAMYTIHEFVYILAFMLPWRVIRVTNSKFYYYRYYKPTVNTNKGKHWNFLQTSKVASIFVVHRKRKFTLVVGRSIHSPEQQNYNTWKMCDFVSFSTVFVSDQAPRLKNFFHAQLS